MVDAFGDTARRVLVVLPSWVGDVVMATPMLRALRALYGEARITGLIQGYVAPVLDASPWCDELIELGEGDGVLGTARRLRRERFDLAVVLPGSFRSGLMVWMSGVRRRVGYAREGRGMLLTDRLSPPREGGRYAPVAAVRYYLALAEHLGARAPSLSVELFTRAADDERAAALLRAAGVEPDSARRGVPLVLLNPGAATKGEAKLWPAERFAAVADALIERRGAAVVVNGSPKERAVLDAVHRAARGELIDLPARGGDLALLKSIARLSDVMITNDTGGRHIAAAMGAAVVSLFGPTDPAWTVLEEVDERIIRAADGRMSSIGVEEVLAAAEAAVDARANVNGEGGG